LAKERLYAAGMISRIEMADEAIKVVKIVDAIENLKLKISTALKDLSFYTGETYIANDIKLTDFKGYEADYEDSFDPEKSPESRIYDLEIEKKKAELEVIKRGRFPQFGLYSNYVWYGNSLNEYDASLKYVKPRNFFVGLSANLPLFEGFKNTAEIEKAKLEIDRLKLEKGKKLAELSSRHAKLSEARHIYTKGVETQKDMLTKTEAKLSMAERLTTQKIIEWVEFLNHRIVLTNQRFELTKTMITKISTVKELKILSEGIN
ncbi:MAG: TolC family protein, partial [Candidatus Woesearchaeota archaeon]